MLLVITGSRDVAADLLFQNRNLDTFRLNYDLWQDYSCAAGICQGPIDARQLVSKSLSSEQMPTVARDYTGATNAAWYAGALAATMATWRSFMAVSFSRCPDRNSTQSSTSLGKARGHDTPRWLQDILRT